MNRKNFLSGIGHGVMCIMDAHIADIRLSTAKPPNHPVAIIGCGSSGFTGCHIIALVSALPSIALETRHLRIDDFQEKIIEYGQQIRFEETLPSKIDHTLLLPVAPSLVYDRPKNSRPPINPFVVSTAIALTKQTRARSDFLHNNPPKRDYFLWYNLAMRIVFFDTETTGNGTKDFLCQLAIKERGVKEPLINATYKPPVPIPLECTMIHHISNKMVADRPAFKDAPEYAEIKALLESDDTICVAHNAAFDDQILKNDDIIIKNLLCTFKTIRELDAEGRFPMHKLQYLRYALDMELDVPAHDAFADVLVLEQLFEYELQEAMKAWSADEEAAIAKMIEITGEPLAIKTINFGKYNGKTIAEVAAIDIGYLSWLLDQKRKSDKDETDWIYTLEKYVS